MQGQLEVFGFPLAEAGGDIGFSVTPYVALTAAPASVDPSSDPTKVYMSDLALFGKDPVTDLLDDLSAGIEGDFTGELYASIDLLFFSLSWNWGIKHPRVQLRAHADLAQPAPAAVPGQTPWPNVTQHGGVADLQRHRRRRQRHLDPGGQQRPHGRLGGPGVARRSTA